MGQKYSKAYLNKKTVGELKELMDQEGLDIEEDAKKPDLVEALLELEDNEDEVDEVDEVDDTDEVDDELDDEDEVAEKATKPTIDEADDELDDDELPEEDEVDDEPAPEPKKKASPKKTKYTEGGKTESGEKLLGAKEVATAIGTDAKSLRQFFRSGKSSFTAVGAGGRYEFKESDVEKIGEEFNAWKANKPGRGARSEGGSTKSRKSRSAKAEQVETLDEVEEIEELEDLDDELDEDDLEIDDED